MFGEKIPVQLVGSAKVTPVIDLSGNKLKLNEDGVWVPVSSSGAQEVSRKQVVQLEKTVQDLQGENAKLNRQIQFLLKNQKNGAGMGMTSPVKQMPVSGTPLDDLRVADYEQEIAISNARIAELEHNLEEAEYRNRLLVAMCTISECDYRDLCREADVDMREVNVGEHRQYDQGHFSPVAQRYTHRH